MPSGKTWYRRLSRPGRHPLPGSDHLESCLISLHSTGTSTGLNIPLVVTPISFSHQGKSNSFSETHFIQSVHMGTSAQAQPTTACITLENKAPHVYSPKPHCLCPWNPGLALLSLLPLHGA